jgi:hypothetical protein
MRSTPDPTTNNPKNHGSCNQQPIAVLSHPNMYSAIIFWQHNNTRQTQYSFQQITKAPHTFSYPTSKILTMTSNKLWNVNTLELPSTIAAANDHNPYPYPYPSLATILSGKHAKLEATRVTKAAELKKFKSRHNELFKEVATIKTSLAKGKTGSINKRP